MYKYNVTYLDKHQNVRNFFISASNERDAIVNAWLDNKEIVEPLDVMQVASQHSSIHNNNS